MNSSFLILFPSKKLLFLSYLKVSEKFPEKFRKFPKNYFSGKFLRKVKIRAIFRGFWRKNGAFSFRKIIFRKLLCSCIFRLSSKRQFPLSFFSLLSPHLKRRKKEKKKAEKKEKIEKIKKKNRKNFL